MYSSTATPAADGGHQQCGKSQHAQLRSLTCAGLVDELCNWGARSTLCFPCYAHVLPQVRIELYDRKQTKFISAHNTPLACLCLSLCGKRLATASDKGTLLRVWNTADGSLLQVSAASMG